MSGTLQQQNMWLYWNTACWVQFSFGLCTFFALLLYIVNVTVTEALSNAFLWSFLWFAIRIGHLTDWRLGSSKQCFSLRFVAHCLVCQCNWTGQNFGAFTPNKAMHKIHSAYLILLDLKKNLLIQLKSFSVVWM